MLLFVNRYILFLKKCSFSGENVLKLESLSTSASHVGP